jgi:uncharacterized protein
MSGSLEARYKQAEQYVRERMEKELLPALVYHRPQHTFDDVLPAAERLAQAEGVSETETWLLKTAAVFHDLGYIERFNDNEVIGARIAGEVLPGFGYNADEITRIKKVILATTAFVQDGRMGQKAGSDILERIICDADLDNFGRPDFIWLGSLIRQEMENFGSKMSDRAWYERQLVMLKHHVYFTLSARLLRDEGKVGNIARIEELLRDL